MGIPNTLLVRAVLCVCFIFIFARPALAAEANMSRADQLQIAKRLFERITGLKVPANDVRVRDMAQHLAGGQKMMAISIALNDPAFTNIRARNFALRLSNKSQSVNVDFNDTSALITGVIRDNLDFRNVLTSAYYYDLKTGGLYGNIYQLQAGNPLLEGDTRMLSLHTDLIQVAGPSILTSYNSGLITTINGNAALSVAQKSTDINSKAITYTANPDPAGILTTRGFASTQYSSGSNRRPVEFLVKNFLCSSMAEIGNSQASDAYVGKDIDRFVGGNHNNYIQNCKSCHTVMDGMRGAFAKVDYAQHTGDQIGLGTLAHGSNATQNKTRRDLWLREYFNAELLEDELPTKLDTAVYVTNMRAANLMDYTFATSKVMTGKLATLAERREEMAYTEQLSLVAPYELTEVYNLFAKTFTGDKSTVLAAVTAGKLSASYTAGTPLAQFLVFIDSQIPATWPVWKKTAYKTTILNARAAQVAIVPKAKEVHRVLKGWSHFLVFSELSKHPELKSLILKDATKVFSATNTNAAWLPLEQSLAYFVQMGNYTFSQTLAEVAVISKTQLDAILANKTDATNLKNYGEKCMSSANINTFLTCEFEYNKDKSFIGQLIIQKITTNGAPADFIKAVSAHIKNVHIGLNNSASVSRRIGWIRYLTSVNQFMYFGGSNFDLDSGVANKMNSGKFEEGYRMADDSFVNLAAESYGWRGPYKSGGRGLSQFGQMFADSRAFSSCMTQQIFKSICYKDLREKPFDLSLWSARFESLGYKVRDLIGEMAASPQCGILPEGQ
ncbi:hypothetical protein [Bdellovibrio sp. HCB337]|uniref:hypothetical protein n=1 Tax=Bdellovibrio sp. HCB337 TaxID=3394358 RepID=UPI0039A62AC0